MLKKSLGFFKGRKRCFSDNILAPILEKPPWFIVSIHHDYLIHFIAPRLFYEFILLTNISISKKCALLTKIPCDSLNFFLQRIVYHNFETCRKENSDLCYKGRNLRKKAFF